MMKHVIGVALSALVCIPQASAQSLLQRSDWQDRKFEAYPPRINTSIPWLEIDTKIKLPKDVPLGHDVAPLGPFVLPCISPHPSVDKNHLQLSEHVARLGAKLSDGGS